ncbi:Xaa-Pro peptidase family protein [Labrenzia sp. DG1229]|uniref:M24 family metallopeptidase n=1 Tax=Labrenzia sp. DG1229 TaxID=681847 RepID=UPI00048C61C1|nr:Xaa-Pro peptidase family protein [Labrenzia sp. DG1229]
MLLNEARLQQVMANHGLDALVATSPENVTYASGYWALSQWIRRGPQSYVYWPAAGKGEPQVVASATLLDLLADQDVNVPNTETFGSFYVETQEGVGLDNLDQTQARLYAQERHSSAQNALAAILKRDGENVRRVGIDEYGLPGSLDAFQLPDVDGIEFVPAFEAFREIRAIKTASEIGRLRRVAEITEDSIKAALNMAKPGVTEIEMAEAFNIETIRGGATPVLYCIGFGTRTAMPNVQPSGAVLSEGDLIRFDAGGRFKHYRADIARNAVLGEPSKKTRDFHRALQLGVERGIEAIRPGVKASDLFDMVVETVRNEGIPHYKRTHVGHGIGIDGYDLPILSGSSQDVLEEGMVLCVETPYYELGFGGLQVEDMIVVRSDGAETLMKTSGKLISI